MKQRKKCMLYAGIVLLLIAALVGCGSKSTMPPSVTTSAATEISVQSDDVSEQNVTVRQGADYGVTLTATDISPSGLTLNVYRKEGGEDVGELSLGSRFVLERCVDETQLVASWEEVGTVTERVDWSAVAYRIPAQTKTELELNWTTIYGTLTPGAYRLGMALSERMEDGSVYGQNLNVSFRIPEQPFSGYGLTLADVPAEKMPPSYPAVNGNLRMTAEDVTACGLTLRFSHEILGGYFYHLERYDGEQWQRVPYLPGDPTVRMFCENLIRLIGQTVTESWSRVLTALPKIWEAGSLMPPIMPISRSRNNRIPRDTCRVPRVFCEFYLIFWRARTIYAVIYLILRGKWCII